MSDEGRIVSRDSNESGLRRGLPPWWWLFAPAALWWMINVGFYGLGIIEVGEIGHRAWAHGSGVFPEWSLALLAYAGVPAVLVALVGVGVAVALTGRRAAVPIVASFLVLTATALALIVLAVWVWPDAAV